MSTKYNGSLPKDPSDWNAALVKYPQTSSVHELETARSASEITVEQFISLKVLWPPRHKATELSTDNVAKLYGSSTVALQALKNETWKNDPPWKAYLTAITASQAVGASGSKLRRTMKLSRDLGVYALVLQAQLEASEIPNSFDESRSLRFTPRYNTRHGATGEHHDFQGKGKEKEASPRSQGSQHPSETSKVSSGARTISPTAHEEAHDFPVGDEQIVNTAATNFLNSLFIHDARLADWTLQRKQFKFKSDSVNFEARTDGHLQVHGHKRSAAILEVKPRVRYHEEGFRIEMQESAQMALWIFQEPNSHWAPPTGGDKYYRVLISQDRQEIYVTIANYTAKYVDYLQNKVKFEHADFLRMNIYGPFHTTDSGHMAWLGAILRKLLPYAAAYRPSRQLSPSQLPRTPSPPTIHLTDERRGRAPGPQAERLGISQRRTTSSPLNPRSKNSSPSSFEHEDPGRLLFGRLAISDNPRSSSQSQSPQRPGISGAQEAAPGRTLSPFSSPPRAGHAPGSGGEQSTRPQGGQPGSQRSREQGDKKGQRKK